MNQQEIQNRYYEGFSRNPVPESENRSVQVSIGKILLMVFVLVGLMLFAFYVGVIVPMLKPKKHRKSADETPENEAVILQFVPDTAEQNPIQDHVPPHDLDERWRQNMQKHGLLETAHLNGHVLADKITDEDENPDNDKSSDTQEDR